MHFPALTRVTATELAWLDAATALNPDEASGDAIHIRLRSGYRDWLVETRYGQFHACVVDHDLKPPAQIDLALSDRLRWFREPDDDLWLGVADDTTAILFDEHTSVAIDLVTTNRTAPTTWTFHTFASADMPFHRFASTIRAARGLPTGVDPTTYPSPPMWLQINPAGVGLHVDWRDFLPSRSTLRMAADAVHGEATAALPHTIAQHFVSELSTVVDGESSLMVGIGDVETADGLRRAVILQCPEWTLVLWAIEVLAKRWGATVEEQLQSFTIVDQEPDEWLMTVDGQAVRVQLHVGHPDTARISTSLGTGFKESLDLLRELGALNAASTGVRFWFDNATLWAATDVECTRLEQLGDAVRAVAKAGHDYGPLIATFVH